MNNDTIRTAMFNYIYDLHKKCLKAITRNFPIALSNILQMSDPLFQLNISKSAINRQSKIK